jgi:hypothetical protein
MPILQYRSDSVPLDVNVLACGERLRDSGGGAIRTGEILVVSQLGTFSPTPRALVLHQEFRLGFSLKYIDEMRLLGIRR